MTAVLLGVTVTVAIIIILAFIGLCAWAGYRLSVRRWGDGAMFLGTAGGAMVAFAVLVGVLAGCSAAGVIR